MEILLAFNSINMIYTINIPKNAVCVYIELGFICRNIAKPVNEPGRKPY
jgi:hypothetical protein